jgi:hypothetical protein
MVIIDTNRKRAANCLVSISAPLKNKVSIIYSIHSLYGIIAVYPIVGPQELNMLYKQTIVGNPDDGFTSAEIMDEAGNYVGRVFELNDGWYVHVDQPERLRDREVVEAVVAAKSELLHYVNRNGADFSEGEWTRAGASLWLMQRDDGKGFTIKTDGEEE